ncbi:hypothetical protein EYF80_001925 [Liparis tanakae]|uniref:Uncharacterized protein n=1 Tax=Liparis tanakae TaxID=230148 RepID=A0A4Z2JD75_9TELE|nr:hypothetical protein EYF80_001925 [Liparis tanakae]
MRRFLPAVSVYFSEGKRWHATGQVAGLKWMAPRSQFRLRRSGAWGPKVEPSQGGGGGGGKQEGKVRKRSLVEVELNRDHVALVLRYVGPGQVQHLWHSWKVHILFSVRADGRFTTGEVGRGPGRRSYRGEKCRAGTGGRNITPTYKMFRNLSHKMSRISVSGLPERAGCVFLPCVVNSAFLVSSGEGRGLVRSGLRSTLVLLGKHTGGNLSALTLRTEERLWVNKLPLTRLFSVRKLKRSARRRDSPASTHRFS